MQLVVGDEEEAKKKAAEVKKAAEDAKKEEEEKKKAGGKGKSRWKKVKMMLPMLAQGRAAAREAALVEGDWLILAHTEHRLGTVQKKL